MQKIEQSLMEVRLAEIIHHYADRCAHLETRLGASETDGRRYQEAYRKLHDALLFLARPADRMVKAQLTKLAREALESVQDL